MTCEISHYTDIQTFSRTRGVFKVQICVTQEIVHFGWSSYYKSYEKWPKLTRNIIFFSRDFGKIFQTDEIYGFNRIHVTQWDKKKRKSSVGKTKKKMQKEHNIMRGKWRTKQGISNDEKKR